MWGNGLDSMIKKGYWLGSTTPVQVSGNGASSWNLLFIQGHRQVFVVRQVCALQSGRDANSAPNLGVASDWASKPDRPLAVLCHSAKSLAGLFGWE